MDRLRGDRELDRLVFNESTSVAHFATMLAALVYSFFESFLDAPQLPMWNVWIFGILAWIIGRALLRRSYS